MPVVSLRSKSQVVDLVPNGRNIMVDDSNKAQYIQLLVSPVRISGLD
jgi:hypothetical protein